MYYIGVCVLVCVFIVPYTVGCMFLSGIGMELKHTPYFSICLCVEKLFSWMSKYICDNIVPVSVSVYPCYVTVSLWVTLFLCDMILCEWVLPYLCYMSVSLWVSICVSFVWRSVLIAIYLLLECESLSEYLTQRCDIISDYAYLILRCLCE